MGFYVIFAGILLLVSFIAFIVYCAKGGNLLLGLLVMATFWFILGAGHSIIEVRGNGWMIAGNKTNFWNVIMGDMSEVFQGGPAAYGGTIAIIIFASWFGRVLVDTGIAKALIRKVVELAGDQQLITVILVSIVSALMFTSIFGAGSVIAMGAIILPILFSMGVSKKLAVGAFIMSVAAGMYVNGGYDSQFLGHALFKAINDVDGFKAAFTGFTWTAFGVHVLVMLGFILTTYFLSKDKVRAWAIPDDLGGQTPTTESSSLEPPTVKGYTFIVPFIPIVLALVTSLLGFIPAIKGLASLQSTLLLFWVHSLD